MTEVEWNKVRPLRAGEVPIPPKLRSKLDELLPIPKTGSRTDGELMHELSRRGMLAWMPLLRAGLTDQELANLVFVANSYSLGMDGVLGAYLQRQRDREMNPMDVQLVNRIELVRPEPAERKPELTAGTRGAIMWYLRNCGYSIGSKRPTDKDLIGKLEQMDRFNWEGLTGIEGIGPRRRDEILRVGESLGFDMKHTGVGTGIYIDDVSEGIFADQEELSRAYELAKGHGAVVLKKDMSIDLMLSQEMNAKLEKIEGDWPNGDANDLPWEAGYLVAVASIFESRPLFSQIMDHWQSLCAKNAGRKKSRA